MALPLTIATVLVAALITGACTFETQLFHFVCHFLLHFLFHYFGHGVDLQRVVGGLSTAASISMAVTLVAFVEAAMFVRAVIPAGRSRKFCFSKSQKITFGHRVCVPEALKRLKILNHFTWKIISLIILYKSQIKAKVGINI